MKLSPRSRSAIENLKTTWVVRSANIAIENRVETLVERISKAVRAMSGGFFPELVSMLGTPQDFSAIGARRWKGLSAAWIKRKGHINFYAYTSQPGKGGRRVRKRLGYGNPLLPALKKTSYERAFGAPEVVLLDSTSIRNQRNRNVVTKIKLQVTLYPAMKPADLKQGEVEHAMFRRGALTARNKQKLRGKVPTAVRPVILPMMSFYSRVKLPQLFRDILRLNTGGTFTMRQR